ncbi:Uncharacterised protein [Chlamydia trachomatis]|nr:Uncharacterised protein [Chlamydia trachomatis]CRH48935.1 Uncharacterised protein [Chlamydia trachomatis]
MWKITPRSLHNAASSGIASRNPVIPFAADMENSKVRGERASARSDSFTRPFLLVTQS